MAKRTGLKPDLLRAWEKRYHVVEPTRSAGGQRHYSDADIEHLRLLVKVTAAGRQIGQVAGLSDSELRAMVAADTEQAQASMAAGTTDAAAAHYIKAALAAAENFDASAFESTLRTATLMLPSDQVLDEVFGPLLMAIGTRWSEGRFPPANGHLATAVIRRVLGWMTDSMPVRDDAPTIVIATPAFQMHDLGAMLAATAAAGSGWRVTFLGASLPAGEISRAARLADADTVALSIVSPTDDLRVTKELRQLRAELPESVALIIGGAGASAYSDLLNEIGAHQLKSISALREWLRNRDPRSPGSANE
ncbi:MAG: cobalamin B12-binding domain-containing protein [Xanthomonadales bacterium]|nr:cobalamin B12-binding domain-containing protein [Xanthomonadales bacterium]